ncbi:hypothetical protein BMS3Abin16_00101 [archaeon BMS3Abin16]|nr:hypothetical protein BMS3Abin16_00101 [archaeon BMS3Abin16]
MIVISYTAIEVTIIFSESLFSKLPIGKVMSKKKPKKQKQSVYIDTVFLIGFFEKRDLRDHAKEVIQKVKGMCHNSDISVKIPLVALGEVSKENIETTNANKWRNPCGECKLSMVLTDLFGKEINAEFVSAGKEDYQLAYQLMDKDPQLDGADALIVASALNDSTARWLLTTDSIMLNNIGIEEFKEQKESNLKIADRFR